MIFIKTCEQNFFRRCRRINADFEFPFRHQLLRDVLPENGSPANGKVRFQLVIKLQEFLVNTFAEYDLPFLAKQVDCLM
jgi:hypothetical protein